MTDKEIQVIFEEKIAIIKQYSNKWLKPYVIEPGQLYDYQKVRERIPPLNPIYREAVEYRQMMRVHSDINNKPIDLMRRRAPNEDDRQYYYRLNNFENVTMPYFMKALSKLNRIYNPSNFSVQWKQSQEDEKKFFDQEIPLFGSLLSYFEEIVLTQKILDPNAILVVKPYTLPYKEIEDSEGNVLKVTDDAQKIVPVPCVINCEDVIDYKEGSWALIRLQEKSVVSVGGNNQKKKEGLIFEFYDSENIYRITQIGKKSDWKFTPPEVYYNHGLGYLPAWKLKGIPETKEMEVVHQSYFIYAIPNLNIALYAHSQLDMSLTTHMFPQLAEWVDRCREMGCNNGYISEEREGIMTTRMCGACNGTGKMIKRGPQMTKQFVIPDPTQGDTDINAVPFPGMEYVAPNPDVPQFVYDKFLQDVANAFIFINMELSNTNVKGSDTALGKQIDREELFAMLMRISNESFSLFDKAQATMGRMRYTESFEPPIVSAPTSFSIRSESDLLMELSEAKKAGVPDVALSEIVKEYIEKRYSNRANIQKIVKLAFAVDRLIVKIQIETSLMLANGTASKLEVVLHDSIFNFIDQLSQEGSGEENLTSFWDLPLKQQEDKLWTMAREKLNAIEAEQPGDPKKILQIANDAA